MRESGKKECHMEKRPSFLSYRPNAFTIFSRESFCVTLMGKVLPIDLQVPSHWPIKNCHSLLIMGRDSI